MRQGEKSWAEQGVFFGGSSWKYQGWLHGMNGGSLRQPTQKLVDSHMRNLRQAMKNCGLEPWEDPDKDFFVGRNPA